MGRIIPQWINELSGDYDDFKNTTELEFFILTNVKRILTGFGFNIIGMSLKLQYSLIHRAPQVYVFDDNNEIMVIGVGALTSLSLRDIMSGYHYAITMQSDLIVTINKNKLRHFLN